MLGSGKWTLCLGAGTSRGLAPTWQELTRRVVNHVTAASLTPAQFAALVAQSSWGLDAWLQAAFNHFERAGGAVAEFDDVLADALYSDLLTSPSADAIAEPLTRLLVDPRALSPAHIRRICKFFETEFGNTSLVQNARFLVEAERHHQLPFAIITFNADILLYAVVEAFRIRDHHTVAGVGTLPGRCYKPVLRGTDSALRLLPIYHCHGALVPVKTPTTRRRAARDKLVFREASYLEIANVAGSWAETLFSFHAQTTHMVFVGLSMSDPNIRRWLAASQTASKGDVLALTGRETTTPHHLWITTRLGNDAADILMDGGITHLGTRTAWLNSWDHLYAALSSLVGL